MKLPERAELIGLLAANSFRLGEFTLSSGIKSDYYIDCRTTTLHARGAELTGRVFLDLFREQGWRPRAVGGLTMGADPVVVAVSVISSQAGAPVVIVDDVCTTGSSTIQAIEAAREFGFQIIGVACLVEREEAGGRPAVEKAAAPAAFVSIFRSGQIKTAHLQLKQTPQTFAYSGVCEVCGRPAVTNEPRLRCAAHQS